MWPFTFSEILFDILFPGIILPHLSDTSLIVHELSDLDKTVCIALSVVGPRVDKNIFWHTVIFSTVSFSMWKTLVYLLSLFLEFFFFSRIGVIGSTMCEIHMFCLSFVRLSLHFLLHLFFLTRSSCFTRTKNRMFLLVSFHSFL